jgi:hypothetical protein
LPWTSGAVGGEEAAQQRRERTRDDQLSLDGRRLYVTNSLYST